MNLPSAPVVYPLGVRGDGLERVAARWRREWCCRGELRRQTPGGLLLSVGLNDTARVGRIDGRPQLDVEAFSFGLGQLLNEMTQEMQVFVLGLTAVDEHVMPFAGCFWYANSQIAATEAVMAEQCREADVPFLSMHQEMQEQSDWLAWMEPDGIHLNADGHRWLDQRLDQWAPLRDWAGLAPIYTSTPISM
jgi:lysophospholipase L1-like esterase